MNKGCRKASELSSDIELEVAVFLLLLPSSPEGSAQMEMDAPVQRYPTPKEPYLDSLPQLLAMVCIGEHSVLGIVNPNTWYVVI
ncbi:hypothetical protein KIPB_012655 [Kipferlia bialata]|uniref:Uncharacterized protein n=1 Tax=Kipferlia bialata TaxID=797122 RepID=A0A391P0C0_9EUKA|nr:hypothetical protein KIPB_012655 [Kipferlia bialata]|eukprot:g12655.t1